MPDPVTLGFLCASALSLAADGAIKGFAGEAAKSAYSALKAKISTWAADDVAQLEKSPNSNARKAVLAELIDQLPSEEKSAIDPLVKALSAALKTEPLTGISIGQLEALEVNLKSITVTDGTGISIGKAKLAGNFNIDGLKVGDAGNS
ncbi:hypothetical protein [Bradyrhizobium sp. BR 10289]|uniref:hypothetical protein n=1 Tax=Bradyrhizobium sp. BR 10289 TaxID=2749993 RepID=UPI001C64D71B|nr:hypothetical protein [Bradyrhizobium sp. BR 10289]MBW7972955.1 hypothetical protein [Bradyrhizobium sp. BR 10289]